MELIRDYSWFFSVALPIFGWGVIIWNGTRLAHRSEARALCTSIQALVDKIDQSARKEWAGVRNLSRVEEESFIVDVNTLEVRIQRFNKVVGRVDCNSSLARLRVNLAEEVRFSDDLLEENERLCREKIFDIWSVCSEINSVVEDFYIENYGYSRWVRLGRWFNGVVERWWGKRIVICVVAFFGALAGLIILFD